MQKSPTQTKSLQGFTLIELLIALSIVAVLCLLAFPFSHDFFLKNKLLARTEELASALHYARSQAVLLGQPLILSSIKENWSYGMVLFVDTNDNHSYDAADIFIFKWVWSDQDLQVTWKGMYDNYLLFAPTGLNSVLAGTFSLCSSAKSGKNIRMNRVGRIRVEEDEETCHTANK